MSMFSAVEEALGVRLSLSLPEFNAEHEYCEPIEPESILDPCSATIWGGQMLPDSIPIRGNGMGDVILARFTFDGSLKEIVEWHHEAGTWNPSDFVPGHESPTVAHYKATEDALRPGLLGYCEEHGGENLANELGISWNEMRSWLGDTAAIGTTYRRTIEDLVGGDEQQLFRQDWTTAEEKALEAAATRADLCWPGAVIGRVAEKRGDQESAAKWYEKSLSGLHSTCGFTKAWDDYGTPFSSQRLQEMQQGSSSLGNGVWQTGLDMLEIRECWMEKGKAALQDGNCVLAYESFYRAGWDRHFVDDMDSVLEYLVLAAHGANSPALAALAKHHLEALKAQDRSD